MNILLDWSEVVLGEDGIWDIGIADGFGCVSTKEWHRDRQTIDEMLPGRLAPEWPLDFKSRKMVTARFFAILPNVMN